MAVAAVIAMLATALAQLIASAPVAEAQVGSCVEVPQSDSLVGWWEFDSDFSEKFGSFPVGTATGSASIDPAGQVGGAAAFSNGRIDTTGDLGLGSGDFSIDMWVKVSPGAPIQHPFSHRDSENGDGFAPYLFNPGGGYVPGIVLSGGTAFTAPSALVIPADDQFHLLVVTVTAAGQINFYVDDSGPVPVTGVAGVRDSSTQQIKFGQDWDNGAENDNFAGAIDEVEIFNSILNPEDVTSLFNAGSAGKCDPPQLTVTKTTNDEINAGDIAFGDPITWIVTIENTGGHTIENIAAIDDIEGSMNCDATSLDPGGSTTCEIIGTALLGDYENTVTVTGVSTTAAAVEESSTSNYSGVGDVAPITVEKFTNGISGHAGDILPGTDVTWTYVITNNTNYALVNLSVEDDPEGLASCAGGADSIPPGGSLECGITGEAIPGEYTNSVEVVGVIEGIGEVAATDSGGYNGTVLECVAVPQLDSLVGWWEFDLDFSEKFGTFPVGTATGGASIDPAGQVGGAATFSDGRVDTTGDLGLDAGDLSVDMWVKTDPQNNTQHMVTYRDDSTGFGRVESFV